MSGAVDTKTVEMRFDNQNFESNAKQSISTLEKLKSALKLDGASKGLSDIEKASKKLDFKDLDRSVGGLGKSFSALEAIATGVFFRIGQKAADAGLKIVKSLTIDQLTAGWSKYEEKTTAVQTIMSNLRDTTGRFIDEASKMDYVNQQIEKLNWFSDETSYSLTDMTSNVGKFIANGQGLEESVTAMQGIATWAALSGQNSQVAARAMYNISQAMGTGSMLVKDWMSIENANMATAEFKELAITIAQNKGKIKEGQVTIQNFRESLSGKDTKGWFDKEVMMDVFSTYGEAADKIQAYTIKTGETATDVIRKIQNGNKKLAEEIGITADSIGFRALVAAQEAKTLGEAITATGDAVSTKWMQIFELIFGNYLQQKKLWTDLSTDLWDVFAAPLDNLKSIFEVWNKGFEGISGRDNFIASLKNIFDIVIHDGDDTVSILTSITSAFKEVFGLDKDAETLGKRLWDLTKRFKEFTERLKPSEETLEKIKNSFKGLFTVFKIGGKLVSAIVKPFKDLFGNVFKNVLSGVLDLADGFGSLIQRFDQFLDENKVFDAISNGISWGLQKIGEGLDFVSQMLAGVSFKEFFGNLKTKVGSFFTNLDFSGVGSTFSSIISQIKQVRTEDLPEKLTPLQNFYIGITNIFSGMRKFFGSISPAFKFIGEKINSFFESIGEAFANRKAGRSVSRFAPIWEGIKSIFSGIGDFFEKIGPTLGKVGNWLGEALGKLGEGIAKFTENKSGLEIVESILKGGFILSLTNLVNSIAGLNRGGKGILSSISKDLDAVRGVLKAYQREINVSTLLELAMAIGVLSGSMWILAQIPADKIKTVGHALLQLAVVLAGFSAIKEVIKALTKANAVMEGKDPNSLFGKIKSIFTGVVQTSIFANDASAKFVKVSAGIALLALAVSKIAKSLASFAEGITALGEASNKPGFNDGLKALALLAAGIGALSLLSGIGSRGALSAVMSVLAFLALVKLASTMIDEISSLGKNTNMVFFKSGLYVFGMLAAVLTIFNTLNSITKTTRVLPAVLGDLILIKVLAKLADVLVNFKKLGLKVMSQEFAVLIGLIGVLSLFNAIAGTMRPLAAINLIASILADIALVGILYTLGLGLYLLANNLTNSQIKTAGSIIIGLIGVLALFNLFSGIGGTKKFVAMLGSFLAMLAVIGVIVAISQALYKLAKEVDPSKLKTASWCIGIISGVLLAAILAFSIIEKIGKKRGSVAIAGAAVLAAAAGLYLIALALAKLSGVKGDLGAARGSLLAMTGLIGIVLSILGLVSGLNFRFGKVGAPISGAFYGTLGVPVGAISFVAACAGVYIMALALEKLASVNPSWENVFKLAAMSGLIALVVGILGLAAGINVAGYATVGAAGVFGGYFGSLGVPLAAVSFAVACKGVYVMAEALAILDTANPSWEKVGKLAAMSGLIALVIDILGLAAGINIAGYATVGAAGIAGGYFGSLGVPLAALSFAAACQGVYVMAQALAMLSNEADIDKLDIAGRVIQKLTVTIGFVLALLGVIAGFTGLGMLVGAVSFDLIVLGISGLVDVLDRFAHVDLSGLKTNLEQVADALKEFFVRAGDAIDKALELGDKVAPVAVKLGLALVVLAAGVAAIGVALIVLGIGLSAVGQGASDAGQGINDAADAFVELAGKDLSGIGKNLAIMAVALVGIGSAGLLASPGLIALGFAIETVLGPITRATEAVGDLLASIDKLKNGGSGFEGPSAKISAGSFVSGPLGWLIRGAEFVYDAVTGAKKEAEQMGPSIAEGADKGVQEAAPKLEATGKKVDESVAKGTKESTMAESAAYEKWLSMYSSLTSGDNMTKAKQGGFNFLSMFGDGALSFDISSVGTMTLGELFTSLQNGGKDAGPIGLMIASMFGDSFASYDFEAMSNMALDEIIVTLSNGKIDIKTAGDLLTQTFGDRWRDFDWKKMTLNDVMKVISMSMTDSTSDIETTASNVSEAGATAMEQEARYGAAGSKNVDGYMAALWKGVELVGPAAEGLGSAVEKPLTSLNAYGWGSDLGSQYASGISASQYLVRAAASAVASIVSAFLHFSEPDVGPLSDFHTYAPDMIKLWCSGIYSNLDKVESSSNAMADSVYDGFSTALEYVSDLIDNGMSDELAIRPVMDLSGIQNGIHNMGSLISGANGYTISGTARLASTTAYGMSTRMPTAAEQAPAVAGAGVNNYNTFNITNDDPQAVAQKVSRILDQGTKREQAVWAR